MIIMKDRERLKKLRLEAGLSQRKLASKLNICYSTYRRMEKDIFSTNSRHVVKVVKFFNIRLDYLLCLDSVKDRKNP